MTTVTMVTRGSPDMLADIVADGLIRSLGRQNVHLVCGITHSGDTMKAQFFQGYAEPNRIGFYETDAIVCSTRSCVADIEGWVRQTGRRASAALDGEDDAVIRSDFLSSAKLYFKREYLVGRTYDQRIRPLQFGAIPEPEPPAAVKSGVFVKWRENDPIRTRITALAKSMGIDFMLSDMWAKGRYSRGLAEALISISARGAGWDTYRYWEIPYFGAALLSQNVALVIPGNFAPGREALFFDGMPDCQTKLKLLLNNRALAEMIGVEGRKASLERHLSIHRAKTVLEALL
jgi:hypothetical protein